MTTVSWPSGMKSFARSLGEGTQEPDAYERRVCLTGTRPDDEAGGDSFEYSPIPVAYRGWAGHRYQIHSGLYSVHKLSANKHAKGAVLTHILPVSLSILTFVRSD